MRIIRSSLLQKVNTDSHWVHIVEFYCNKDYLDDILVSGKDATEHLNYLWGLLTRLNDKGLRCCREKCTFAESSVEYLGHTLSKEGISQRKKVDAVYNMPPPTDVSSVKSFLGSVQFYGKFYYDTMMSLPVLPERGLRSIRSLWIATASWQVVVALHSRPVRRRR